MSDEAEELLESRHRQLPRRAWLLVVAVVLVVVGGGIALSTRDDDDRPRAAPATTTSSTVSAVPTPAPTSTTAAVPQPGCLDISNSTHSCGVSSTLPRPTLLATRTLLPEAVVVRAYTFVGRDGRVFTRRVLVRAASGSTLTVLIGPANGQRSGVTVAGLNDGSTVQFGDDVSGRHVDISVRTTPGVTVPPVSALRELAADPRLFALR